MRIIIFHNTHATNALSKSRSDTFTYHDLCRNALYLEHLDQDENFSIIQVDDPPARYARHDGIDDRSSRYRIMISHSKLNLVLRRVRVKGQSRLCSYFIQW